jgi:hypothetical protein
VLSVGAAIAAFLLLGSAVDAGSPADGKVSLTSQESRPRVGLVLGGGGGLAADALLVPMCLAYGHAEGGYSRYYFGVGTQF